MSGGVRVDAKMESWLVAFSDVEICSCGEFSIWKSLLMESSPLGITRQDGFDG